MSSYSSSGGAFFRLVLDAADAVPAKLEGVHVFTQTFARCKAETLFQADDVMRRLHNVNVISAGVKAINALVVAEPDDGIALQLAGHDQCIRDRRFVA